MNINHKISYGEIFFDRRACPMNWAKWSFTDFLSTCRIFDFVPFLTAQWFELIHLSKRKVYVFLTGSQVQFRRIWRNSKKLPNENLWFYYITNLCSRFYGLQNRSSPVEPEKSPRKLVWNVCLFLMMLSKRVINGDRSQLTFWKDWHLPYFI